MSDNVFVKKGTFGSLEEFARFAFELFGGRKIVEHQSANYWGSQYFQGRLDDATLTLALADESGFEEYEYWLSVEVDSQSTSDEHALGQEIARRLVLRGMEAARPFSKEDWLYKKSTVKRIIYRKKPQGNDSPNPLSLEVQEEVEEVHLK